MLVTNIQISQYAYDRLSAKHQANVKLTVPGKVVSLFCQLDMPHNETVSSRSVAFVGDAIRQLKRMPEIRSGQQKLSFADNLICQTA